MSISPTRSPPPPLVSYSAPASDPHISTSLVEFSPTASAATEVARRVLRPFEYDAPVEQVSAPKSAKVLAEFLIQQCSNPNAVQGHFEIPKGASFVQVILSIKKRNLAITNRMLPQLIQLTESAEIRWLLLRRIPTEDAFGRSLLSGFFFTALLKKQHRESPPFPLEFYKEVFQRALQEGQYNEFIASEYIRACKTCIPRDGKEAWEEAQTAYIAAKEFLPDSHIYAVFLHACAFAKDENFARAVFDAAKQAKAADQIVYFSYAEVLRSCGYPSAALDLLAQCERVHGANDELHARRIEFTLSSGDEEKALHLFDLHFGNKLPWKNRLDLRNCLKPIAFCYLTRKFQQDHESQRVTVVTGMGDPSYPSTLRAYVMKWAQEHLTDWNCEICPKKPWQLIFTRK